MEFKLKKNRPRDFIRTPDREFPEGALMLSDALEHIARHVALIETRLSSSQPEHLTHEKLQEFAEGLRLSHRGLSDCVAYLRRRFPPSD